MTTLADANEETFAARRGARVHTRALAPAVIALVMVAAGPTFTSFTRFLISLGAISAIATLGLILLTGRGRIVSLASAGFVAIGAYSTAWLMLKLAWPYSGSGALAVILATLFGALLGIPSLRFRGHYLTLVTLIFPVVVVVVIREVGGITGGARGVVFPPIAGIFGLSTEATIYVLSLLTLAVSVYVIGLLANGDVGLALSSIASVEVAAEAFDVRPEAYRVLAFTLSATTGGIAGVLLAPLMRVFEPPTFDLFMSIEFIAMLVVGGMFSAWGALLGAALLTALPEWLRTFAEYEEVIYGSLLLAVVLLTPDGLIGRLGAGYQTLRTQLLPARSPSDEPGIPAKDADRSDWRVVGMAGQPDSPHRSGVANPLPEVSSMPALRAEGLSRNFAGLQALSDVDVELYPGNILGLIGPNGAGKSTLINLLSGVDSPDDGRIILGRSDVTMQRPADRARLGMTRTFQSVRLVSNLTVEENVRLGTVRWSLWESVSRSVRFPHGTAEGDQVEQTLEMLGLANVRSAPCGTLSFGIQRRIEIARALVSQPKILLLDEPAAGLAKSERVQLSALLRELADRQDLALLVVEHDIGFVSSLSNRLAALVGGKLVAHGAPDYVLRDVQVRQAYFGG